MNEERVMRRVRLDLGDSPDPFRTSAVSDGTTTWLDLPKQNISASELRVTIVSGATVTDLVADTDYELDAINGTVHLNDAPNSGDTIIIEGNAYALYTDADLQDFIHEAVIQHTHGRVITERYRDGNGFISYRETPISLDNLPEIEEPLVSMLATIEVLWSLSTDASTDVDIMTAEGTHIPRSARWSQIRAQIDVLTDKYQDLCNQLNVGLHRIEMVNLRRKSYRTGRLVPIFRDREYDDVHLPQRELPPIDNHDPDESGIPSPMWGPRFGV